MEVGTQKIALHCGFYFIHQCRVFNFAISLNKNTFEVEEYSSLAAPGKGE